MDVTMPQLGETVTEGTITRWLKRVGEQVHPDEPLFEVSTDKVDSEVPAPVGGVLSQILVPEGETAAVGTVLAVIGDSAAAPAIASPVVTLAAPVTPTAPVAPSPMVPSAPASPSPSPPTEVFQPPAEVFAAAAAPPPAPPSGAPAPGIAPPVPAAPTSTPEAAAAGLTSPVTRRLIAEHGLDPASIRGTGEGGRITRRDVLAAAAAASSAPVSAAVPEEIPAEPEDSTQLLSIPVEPPVETPVVEVPVVEVPPVAPLPAPLPVPPVAPAPVEPVVPVATAPVETVVPLASSPVAPVPVPEIPPAPPVAPAAPVVEAPPAVAPVPSPAPAPVFVPGAAPTSPVHPGGDEIVPFTAIRRRTAEHMVRSKVTSAHVYTSVEVDFERVERIREAHQAEWRAHESFGLTYLPFVARAVADTIGEFPNVNASVVDESLVVHHDVHLAIAVDLNTEGLVAPVIRNADGKRLRQLAREIRDLADRARSKQLLPDEVVGGTFTITNPGPYGTYLTLPIINQPQVAILSTDGISKQPRVVELDGEDVIVVRHVGMLALAWDHRAFDGAYAAGFLRSLKDRLERHDWVAELE